MIQRRYQPSLDRGQRLLLPDRVEDYVGENNTVRAVDAYVDSLDLAELGFKHTECGTTAGQPPYNPWALLKLYLYGYLKGIRSSRKLEAETRRNLEVIWLVEGIKPSFMCIADFRKEHVRQLREVNREFVLMCRALGLFGGERVAVDGSFFKADAGITSIQTREYTDRALEKIERKIEEYQQALEEQDKKEEDSGGGDTGNDEALSEKLEKMKKMQEHQREIKNQMDESGDSQVSTVDEDARLLRKRGKTVAGYNAQIAVDSKHKLVVAEEVVQDGNDSHQLSAMLGEAKNRLGKQELTGLADAGYYEGMELKKCEDEDVAVYVPIPDTGSRMRKKGRWSADEFEYDAEGDCYHCPEGKQLTPGKQTVERAGKNYTLYSSSSADCRACPMRGRCISENLSITHT